MELIVTEYSNMKKAIQDNKINAQLEPVKPPEPYKG